MSYGKHFFTHPSNINHINNTTHARKGKPQAPPVDLDDELDDLEATSMEMFLLAIGEWEQTAKVIYKTIQALPPAMQERPLRVMGAIRRRMQQTEMAINRSTMLRFLEFLNDIP